MTVLCMLALAGQPTITECVFLSERYGGWEVSCNGKHYNLPEYRCEYEDGREREEIVDEDDERFDDLMNQWKEDPWHELR